MKTMTLVLVGSAAVCGAAMGQHDTDVLLSVIGGRIQTGSVDDAGVLDLDERVFHGVFGEVVPDFSDEPGFDSLPGTFAGGTRVGFRFRAALRVWDGAAFSAIPEERIQAAFGVLGPVETPASDAVVEGFEISVAANGEWHRHLEYTLVRPDGGAPGAGVYLMEMSMRSTDPAVGESRPFWIVWGKDADAVEMEEAEAWVRRVRVCPADFNQDGFVDFFDYLDFVSCFEGEACAGDGDFNGDGFVDFFDYGDFVSAFEAGC